MSNNQKTNKMEKVDNKIVKVSESGIVSFKTGTKFIEISNDDYFLDNGSCIQFVSKDNSKKKLVKSGRLARWYTNISIRPQVWKKLLTLDIFIKEDKQATKNDIPTTSYRLK